MIFDNDCKPRKLEYLNEYQVFLDDASTYSKVYLYLGNYFEERGHPYNLISINTYSQSYDVIKALKDFRAGATYFFEGMMRMANLSYKDKDALVELLKFEYLCVLHEEDIQRILESYKAARMEIVRDLIKAV